LIEACENGGFSKGTNIGLKYSRIKYSNASYCTILNNDTIVTKKFLDTALNVLEGNKTIVAAMGTILYYGYDKPYIWSIGGKINWIKGHGTHVLKNSVFDFSKKYPPYVKRTFVSGCFTIFKTSALEEIKFLDEDYFFAGEEYQYSFDLSKKHLIVWIPNSVIYHKSILEIGNGSSHNIKNIAWQYNAYIVKLLFINKNKSKIYKFFWHISFKMYINCVLKKRYIKSNLYNLKTFLYLRNALFRNINIISFDEKKFNDF
jgi:GT2 family glycosyltransferase